MLCLLLSVVFAVVVFITGTDFAVESVSGPHITDVNILLPPRMTNPVECRLQGSDGCFKWSWDHHDILSVIPEYNESNHCSTSARLRSIAPYTGRKETAVYAADVRTGIVIRCKVYIDIFSRIQIFHNSIKLDLDGLATLRVRAFDSEENVFSSLVGLRFMWQLMPEGDESPHHLVHVPLRDSPLSDCGGFCGDLNIQIRLEDTDAFSDLFVVKGNEIGLEAVSVHLLEPQLDHMADKIVLTVAEAMSLYPPSPVLVLVGALVQYSLKVTRGNIPQVVPLPSSFHQWSALNSSIAQVDSTMGVVHALNMGETSIIVEDTRVAGHVQISSLNVVLPDYLSLYLLPLSKTGDPIEGIEPTLSNARWYVNSGHQYLIELKVFSRGPVAREIYITKNEDVKLYYDQPEHWKNFPVPDCTAVKYAWQNSRILEATSEGLGKLSASLTYSTGQLEAKEVLKVVQEVMVCNQVRLVEEGRGTSLSAILLPWSPDVYQEVVLNAIGGCAKTSGDYRWFSSDSSILSVSAMGVVQAKRPGKAIVKVLSVYDGLNFDEVAIEVSVPSDMAMLPNFPVETVVGSHLQAAVTMQSENGDYFYQCDAFSSSVKWYTGSESFIIVNSTREAFLKNKPIMDDQSKSEYGPTCAWIYLFAASPGRANLQATFSKPLDHSFGRQLMLKASAPIASFSPLIVCQAGDGNQFGGYWFDLEKGETHDELRTLDDLYLAPGTHLDVKLSGGPERWGDGVDFIQTIDIFDAMFAHRKDRALVHKVPTTQGYKYRILCQELGNFTLVFKHGNLVGDDHPQPVVAEAKLRLACSFPSSIVVLADEPVNKLDAVQTAIQADRAPGRVHSMPITVANGRTIRVSAVGISKTGKVFANSSSVPLRWELNNCDELAFWVDANNFQMSASSWERYLALKNASGLCTVHATVQNDIVSRYGYSPLNVLTDAVRLQVVSTLQVFPEFALLFVDPDATMNLSVVGGSCFLDATVNDSRVIEVMQPTLGLQCSQLTLVPRGVGIAAITIYDIGLSLPLTASSLVEVADVDWIKITSGEELSLVEGSTITVDLLAGGINGHTFESSQYAHIKLHVHFDKSVVELVDGENLSSPSDGIISASSFAIYGKCAGVTTLYVTARQQTGQEIYSQTITVEVYTLPVVHPRDIFLVPGAYFVLAVNGGPRIGVVVEYTSMNGSTVAVQESSGLLSAISPGNASIVATFYGNGRTVLCQARGEVKVGVPSVALLNVQSEQLAVGREMAIFPFLLEGDLFSFYELCTNYKWTTENEQVLSFQPAEHINNGNYKLPVPGQRSYADELHVDFIKVLYGRSAGRSNVALTFSCDFSSPGSFSQSMSYSASVSVRVVPDPPLAQGIPVTWILPPHYMTSKLLPLYSESHSRRDIQSQTGTISYSLLGHCGRKDDELQRGAISIYENKIKTTESNSLDCIQAKDHSTGRIEIASCVRVAEVAQIRIQRRSAFHVINAAVGTELELPINFYDQLGNPFLETHDAAVFDIETNYRDILSLGIVSRQNGSAFVKAIRHGRALVMVRFDNNRHKSDYILVSVGAHINPQNPVLYPGTYLNFSIEGLNDQVSGHWLSANESVVSVDSLSGKAVSVGEGAALVTFQSPSLMLQTTIKVLTGNIIYVDAPKDTLTNILFPPGGYNFSVKFSTDKFGAPSGNIEVPYDCTVDPSFVGYAKPWRDHDTGDSYCLFFPYSPEHLSRSVPKLVDRRKDVSITIQATLKEAKDVSGSASALFLTGFSILGMDKDSLQLNLTQVSNTSIITIVGNTDVGIHWSNRDLLIVRSLLIEDYGIGGRAQYEVKVLKAKPFKDKLIFTLPASGQSAELDVNYDPGEEEASAVDIKTWTGVISGFALLILTFSIFICVLDKPYRSPPSVTPSAPSVTAPLTPDRTSHVSERSPRTPQPFVDYVRRTIDETPYYRREGRTRLNPQNTY